MSKYTKNILLTALILLLSLHCFGKEGVRSRIHSHTNIKSKNYKEGYSIGSSINNSGDLSYNFTLIHDSTKTRLFKSYYNAQITVDAFKNLDYNLGYDIGGVSRCNSYGISVDYLPSTSLYDEQIWYTFNSYINLNESLFIYVGPSIEHYSNVFEFDYGVGAMTFLGNMHKINSKKTNSDFYLGYFVGFQTGLFNQDQTQNTTTPYAQISLNIIK